MLLPSIRPRALVLLLAMVGALLAVPVAASAQSAPDYRDPVDITFPVPGEVRFIDDYDQCRGTNCSRRHQATDIMAPLGREVHAAMGGRITFITGLDGNPPSYGYMIRIAGDDGRTYNYVHLGRQDGPPSEAYVGGLERDSRVERGQHIGFNGCSGNAHCSAPHLHFEIVDPQVTDPYGSNIVNPYRSLVDALERGDVPGADGARPVLGDWNGDGKETAGWFRDGVWMLWYTHEPEGDPDLVLTYGQRGDLPVTGDWNGDGRDTIGVVRDNLWLLRPTYVRGSDIKLTYGQRGDLPVTGDWNADGRDTIGVVRDNVWLLRYEYRRGADIRMTYGQRGDLPVAGDWNGNGQDTIGVVRGNQWLLRYAYRSGADIKMHYGHDTDVPVAGDYNGNGTSTLGVVRDGRWILRNAYHRPFDDLVYWAHP